MKRKFARIVIYMEISYTNTKMIGIADFFVMEVVMARTVAIGIQDFEQIIKNDYFYVDKTNFIKEWWESGDSVTLIARPRRFGKTLNMSMLEEFFSLKYTDRGDLFEGLSIWKEEKYRGLQLWMSAFCRKNTEKYDRYFEVYLINYKKIDSNGWYGE